MVRSVSSAMSFIMMDGKTHRLLDIIENRQLSFLERYFIHFSRESRAAVSTLVEPSAIIESKKQTAC